MSRAADYTIKGFLYQFNKSLLEVLRSPDGSTVAIEGVVEDIEVATPSAVTAIQCKYHEASDSFTPSAVFKPLLQMMDHFHRNAAASIRYVLFAYFPRATDSARPTMEKSDLEAALASKNKQYRQYVSTLRGTVDVDAFFKKFSLEFGPTFDELVGQVCAELEVGGIPKIDIDTLAYPNAIHMIAGLSIKHDPKERKITRTQFLEHLRGIRRTAISRWTLALRTRKQLLDARRKQLKTNLDKNSRLRYLIVDAATLDDFQDEIVLFVTDYLDKYHFKQAHISTPILCLRSTEDVFRDIQYRLYTRGVVSTDGCIGEHFFESFFFRTPMLRKNASGGLDREFSLRVMRWEDHIAILKNRKCDDLFILGECDCSSLDTVDVNVEQLAAPTLKEIKYMMGASNVYE